jgi:DeoR family transcriptional regulator, ulaG and ulaABCDEF operon transcriptional repressor
MHANDRERLILEAMRPTGFVSYRELEQLLEASPATIRRDLARMGDAGVIERVHGGARLVEADRSPPTGDDLHLAGTPFDQSITQNLAAKRLIGHAAAQLCGPGEGVMIDGGTTTLQMCPHLAGLGLQVLTNSLHIVNALLPHRDTRILVPSGVLFREQNIILAPAGEDSMPRFHAPKLFMGAAAVGTQGVMQADVVLVAAERRLIGRAEEVILLVDSSKFTSRSGTIVCGLEKLDVVITDDGIPHDMQGSLEAAGIRVVIASEPPSVA